MSTFYLKNVCEKSLKSYPELQNYHYWYKIRSCHSIFTYYRNLH